jgi:hypothetical protein
VSESIIPASYFRESGKGQRTTWLETNNELSFVSLGYAVSVANTFVHKRLSEAWFVQLIVAPATVCNQVNDNVLFNRVENKVRGYKQIVLSGALTLRKK